ncbi:OLC1v1029137C1 [Oldenlandia corymbosa var. corymbosa]|uniref:OLC1v1029137C1 n=1 Tax=Oldenlandia corymbosa var. corymbosa TaxID=529605 RepID=A0AAV1CDY2_OLDCO|nr:OLC1v1029137C1 [Oldenlandia corymbosa var. corymbosa]
MSDQAKTMSTKIPELTPRSKQVAKIMIATAIGAALLGLSSLTLTGTVVALILSTPLLVIFSPAIVPAAILFFLTTVGLLFSSGCAVAAIAALTWIYNYVAGKNPPGADQLDYARMKIASTARDVTEKAKEYGQYVQAKSSGASQ